MPKVFLLSANIIKDPYPVYPLGLAIVASALTSAGHQVRQFDFMIQGSSLTELQRAVEDFNPDYIGVSLRNVDSVDSFNAEESWALASDKALVKGIKAITAAPVVLGGSAFRLCLRQYWTMWRPISVLSERGEGFLPGG